MTPNESPSPPAIRPPAPAARRYTLTVQELEECPPPASARAAILLGLVMLGGFLGWAAHFPVTQRAAGQGEIMPQGFVQPVQHPDGGRVTAILVAPGDRVAEGQALLYIDTAEARAEAEAARARHAALSLAAERLTAAAEGRLAALGPAASDALAPIRDSQAAMAEAAARLRAAQLAVLDAEIASRESAVARETALLASTAEARDLARQEVTVMSAMLERGLARRNEVFSLRQTHLRAEGEVERSVSDIAAARLAVEEARARRDELAARARNEALAELVRVESDRAEAHQALLRAEARLARSVLRAPAAGVVKEMAPRGVGNVLEPGAMVAEIVPEDAGVLATVELPADQVGGVRPGSRARVKVLAYDPARFGSIPGTVRHVSASSFRRQDGSMFFRAEVALDSEHVGDPRRGMRVSPGMSVSAEIATGEVTLLQWLARPVRNILDGAFAER
ncbi:HlyD family type I secretion periplasmic adaptor subunit [Roseomonas sp. PWR1]|uniref:Membrane fusion protein (MFP) family protein n=1 Tax=Roseomonas nitratireducens TaxID=2820810 RepID=A0ABS4ASA9_9PROT|nr:HlyD family type I secretion periplasmic adaptor subunit [Neoroseomonas nitratireducens]MBP0464238.1 HlyD family type I secretion periplasmic adaptor subunit [Neoroseomonas nitratireducens]